MWIITHDYNYWSPIYKQKKKTIITKEKANIIKEENIRSFKEIMPKKVKPRFLKKK